MMYPQGSWAGAWDRVRSRGWVAGTLIALVAGASLWATDALAGPNAGGTLLVHTDTSIVYTDDDVYYEASGIFCGHASACPTENGTSCQDGIAWADPNGSSGGQGQVWWVLAAFPYESCPKVTSVSFGIHYPESELEVIGFAHGADSAEPSAGFPFEDTSGVRLDYTTPQRSQLVELGWFWGKVLAGTPYFDLAPHPTEPSEFLDDSAPRQPDAIAGFSTLGFGVAGYQAYPGPGGTGEGACCQPDGSCSIVPYEDCQDFGEYYHGDDTTCETWSCPVGACCLPNETCIFVTYDACMAESGDYQGDDVPCASANCTADGYGACCAWDGFCYVATDEDCAFNSDEFRGVGTVCDPNPCDEIDGACCEDDGSCALKPPVDCSAVGGDYLGDFTDCVPNPCPTPSGACCFTNGSCSFVTQSECGFLGGAFQGLETSCSPDPCPDPEGACCSGTGSCTILGSAACLSSGGSYLGNGTTCVPDPCPDPSGACCLPNGSCSVLTSEACLGQSGSYLGGGTTCSPNPCPDPTGACCRTDGSCFVTTSALCSTEGSSYQGNGASCVPDPCPDPTGACCLPSGACSVITQSECSSQSGAYQGNQVACSPNPCPDPSGACCFASGTCAYVTATDCGEALGSYQGDAIPCSPNPCPDPTGACCFADGSCLIDTSGDCSTSGGGYQGNETVCSPNPCPQPPEEGACCFADGSCTFGTEAACVTAEGTYEGDDSACSPNPCPQPPEEGACCFTDGSCTFGTEAACVTAEGVYEGDNSACSPNPCPQPDPEGACCFGDGRCSVGTEDSCGSGEGSYQGDDTVCDPNPCPQPPPEGACCRADGSCRVETSGKCVSDSGVYQGDDTVCDPNPCPQPPAEGACCASDGGCTLVTESDCTTASGDYEGDETVCSPNPCPQPPAEGACCDTDGSCTVATRSDCGSSSGTYEGDASVCDPNPCTQPARGACCAEDGGCIVSTETDCADGDGAYEGHDTACDPNPCPQPARDGACCQTDGSCSIGTEVACSSAGGEFLAEVAVCSPHPCDLDPHVETTLEGSPGSRFWAVSAPDFVSSVEGHYRMGGESDYRRLTTWTEGEDGVWRTPMDDTHYTERGLEYHLVFDGTLPVGGPENPRRLRTLGHSVNGPRLFDGRWSMISAPVLVEGMGTYYSKLVQIFGDPSGDAWRVGTYDPLRSEYVQVSAGRPAAFEPGRAYWVGAVDAPSSWSIAGDSHLPLDGALHFIVPLRPGWNMVGNPAPYSVTLDRSHLQVVNGDTLSFAAASSPSKQWVASSILTFDPVGEGSYKNELVTLPVWEGCWIQNRTSSTMALLIPAAEALSSLTETPDRGFATSLGRDRFGPISWVGATGSVYALDAPPVWTVEFVARSEEESRSALVGIVETESPSGSDLGFLPPPIPGAELEISLLGGGETIAAGEKLYQELRTRSGRGEEVWRLAIDAGSGVDLSWAATAGHSAGWNLQLRDAVGNEWNLGGAGSLVVPPGRHEFEVIARKSDPGLPVVPALGLEVQPNPTTSSARLHYQIPYAGRLLLQVFGPDGGRVWAHETDIGVGEYVTVWDGRAADGQRVASGIYFVRADAVSRETGASEHRIEKLVIVR